MAIKKICVIAQAYPSDDNPIFSFLENVVNKFVDSGIECIVITPISWLEKQSTKTRIRKTEKGNSVRIICPRFMMFPSRKIGNFETVSLTINSFCKAAYKAFLKYVYSCDVIYSHFINMAGIAASYISKREKVPCVTACGESDLSKNLNVYNLYKKKINDINGFITVSSTLKNNLFSYGIIDGNKKIIVLPNAVDLNTFHKKSRRDARERLGISQNIFVVIFIGHFIERKGIQKLIAAINQCNDVYGIFIGGNRLPQICNHSLIVKKVQHDDLPIYLNASDVFVLPTINEGCCNAILEAQACGVPIITSDRDFNRDILTSQSAVLINPLSVEEIRDSIKKVKDDIKLQSDLSKASLECSKEHDINTRIKRILEFLELIVTEYNAN